MFELYAYNHCPFCMRVRMIFGFHHIPYKLTILANDDEQTPIRLIGKKVVPILIKENGDSMAESMDIINYIDQYAQQTKHKLPLDRDVREAVSQWQKNITQYHNHLVMPRAVKVCTADFPTESAAAYFTNKKTEMVGEFAENLANSEYYIDKVQKDLLALKPLIEHNVSLKEKESMEDILVFPVLRSLSMVKGIHWPEKVKDYAISMGDLTNMPLFFDRAI